MDTGKLKKFAPAARKQLREAVTLRLDQSLREGSIESRERRQAVEELHRQVAATSREAVIERAAYIWFNRFCALRFMDANGYTRVGTVTPRQAHSQPAILADAKAGHFDDELFTPRLQRSRINDLLSRAITHDNPEQEAYRLLLLDVCNSYHELMPFMFERIEDFTELLMPDDLLSDSSILAKIREALSDEVCQDVEVIGWLYQFYISERKDEVFAGFKKNKKA
ncbi:class I SAM-dependent DNA methyltransferase, partial [bacterium]|nr:class I SAM-dependent DNA methyltransferase [bacterium]